MMYNDWPGWGGWLAMGLMMLAFVGLILVIVLVAVRSLNQPPESTAPPTANSADTAYRVLEDRFARGEIDAPEYAHRRDLLRSSPTHAP